MREPSIMKPNWMPKIPKRYHLVARKLLASVDILHLQVKRRLAINADIGLCSDKSCIGNQVRSTSARALKRAFRSSEKIRAYSVLRFDLFSFSESTNSGLATGTVKLARSQKSIRLPYLCRKRA